MTQYPPKHTRPQKRKPTDPARDLAGRMEEATAKDLGWASRSSAANVVENREDANARTTAALQSRAQHLASGLQACWGHAQAIFGEQATPQVAVELLALCLDVGTAGMPAPE